MIVTTIPLDTSNALVPASCPETLLSYRLSGTTGTFIENTDLASNDTNLHTELTGKLTPLTLTPVSVPKEYFGLNTGSNGKMKTLPMANFAYGLVRSHDNAGVTWQDIEGKIYTLVRVGNVVTARTSGYYDNVIRLGDIITISGVAEEGFNGEFTVTWKSTSGNPSFQYISPITLNTTATTASMIMYTYWGHLDEWVTVNKVAGRQLIYTVYQVPEWAASNPSSSGPYGGRGWNTAPASQQTLHNFITRVANRYLLMGFIIDYYEISNEPNYGTFYVGTKSSLAEQCRTVNLAVKSITPASKIISPSLTDMANQPATSTYFSDMIIASDNNGGTMAQWIDIVGIHLYGANTSIPLFISTLNNMMVTLGIAHLPIIDTENSAMSGRTTITITNLVRVNNLVTITLAGNHNLANILFKDTAGYSGYVTYSESFTGNFKFNYVNATTLTYHQIGPDETGTVFGVFQSSGLYGDTEFIKNIIQRAVIPACLGVIGQCGYSLGNPIDTLTITSNDTTPSARPEAMRVVTSIFNKIITYGISSANILANGTVVFTVNNVMYSF